MSLPEVRFVSESNINVCLPLIHQLHPQFTPEQAVRWWRAETCQGHHLIAIYVHGHIAALSGFSVRERDNGSSVLLGDEVAYVADGNHTVLHECLMTYLKVLARAFRCNAIEMAETSRAA